MEKAPEGEKLPTRQERNGFGSLIVRKPALIAMLAGQIAAGLVFEHRWRALGASPAAAWQAAFVPLVILVVLSIPAILLAGMVPRAPAPGGEKLRRALGADRFRHLRGLWSDAPLRRASFACAYFWGFAAYINLWLIKLAAELSGDRAGFALCSLYLAAAALGMISGFATAAWLLRRRIELGWVPVGGSAMAALPVAMALLDPSGRLFPWVLAALAFSSALFLAPLNAWMQDRFPAARRGEFQAAVNLQDCLAAMLAFVILIGISALAPAAGFSPMASLRGQIGAIGISSGLITWFIIRLLPSDFIRVIGLMLLRLVYRIRSSGEKHLPKTGGALLLPNHITWADAFFLTAACPRPVRFIMEEGFMGQRAIRVFCQLFDTVPISSAKPREALRASAESLKQGHVVCIFPEGQLTRTGTLRELKRGFEIIARQAGCPLVPAWIDGAWGSILSFEGGRFFRKFPHRLRYGITVGFAPPIPHSEADLECVRRGMLEASAMALDTRLGLFSPVPARRAIRANALQIGQVNALQRHRIYAVLEDDALPGALPGLVEFGRLFKASPQQHASLEARVPWLGGEVLRQRIESSPPREVAAVFFDFSPRASTPLDHPDWIHCPCLAINGVVVAMSMPDPPEPYPGSKPQPGRRTGSLGILLPGFLIEESGGAWAVRGPAAPDGLKLPDGLRLDGESFVIPSV